MTPPRDTIPTQAYPPCAPGPLRPGADLQDARPPFAAEVGDDDDVVVDFLGRVLGKHAAAGLRSAQAARQAGDRSRRMAGLSPAQARSLKSDLTDVLLAVAIFVLAGVMGWAMIGVMIALWVRS